MSVSRAGYYKWKHRQEHPTTKIISRQSDIDLIKEIHKKHPSHGYRWINAYARNKYGVVVVLAGTIMLEIQNRKIDK